MNASRPNCPARMRPTEDWQQAGQRWAELVVLRWECDESLDAADRDAWDSLQGKVEDQFGAWMLDRYGSLHNLPYHQQPVMVHQIPHFLAVERTRKKLAKIALLVLDGMASTSGSCCDGTSKPSDPRWRFQETTAFAWVPTLTSVTRQTIFAGEAPFYFPDSLATTAKEKAHWQRFWENQGLQRGTVELVTSLDSASDPRLDQALGNPRLSVLGIVWNKIDDIMHGMQMQTAGMHNQVRLWASQGHLSDLLHRLAKRELRRLRHGGPRQRDGHGDRQSEGGGPGGNEGDSGSGSTTVRTSGRRSQRNSPSRSDGRGTVCLPVVMSCSQEISRRSRTKARGSWPTVASHWKKSWSRSWQSPGRTHEDGDRDRPEDQACLARCPAGPTLAQTTDPEELRRFMDERLAEELPGSCLTCQVGRDQPQDLERNPGQRVPLRDRAVALLPKISGQERIWLHWGMTSLAYPFFRDTAEVVGRLLTLQDDFTTAQVQERLLKKWGDRATTKEAAQKLLNTLVDWEVLRVDEDERALPSGPPGCRSIDARLQLWLLESLLTASSAEEVEAQQFLRLPEMFPFTLSIGLSDLRTTRGLPSPSSRDWTWIWSRCGRSRVRPRQSLRRRSLRKSLKSQPPACFERLPMRSRRNQSLDQTFERSRRLLAYPLRNPLLSRNRSVHPRWFSLSIGGA